MEEPILSIGQFIESILKQKNSERRMCCYYRGVKQRKYKLEPSVFRNQKHSKYEEKLLNELVSTRPSDFSGDRTTFDTLIRAQHHGLPTRLLDLTINPLFALYFACGELNQDFAEMDQDAVVYEILYPWDEEKTFDSDTVSVLSNLARLNNSERESIKKYLLYEWKKNDRDAIERFKDKSFIKKFNRRKDVKRLLQFIRYERPSFEDRIEPLHLIDIFPVLPKRSNARIIAQSGSFLIFGLNGDIRHSQFQNLRSVEINRYFIDRSAVKAIRDDLEKLSISENSLFPELERASSVLKAKYG